MNYTVEYQSGGGFWQSHGSYRLLDLAHEVFLRLVADGFFHVRVVPYTIFEGWPHPLEVFYEHDALGSCDVSQETVCWQEEGF